MAEIPYVCLYARYLQTLAPFTDAERGRIMTAMLVYFTTGEIPEFEGNERYIWPTIQAQIDRDVSAYQEKCAKNRANGAKGGRPPRNPTVIPETERLFEKPKKANTNTNTNTKTNERDINANISPSPSHFSPPSVDEVRAYCNERGYTTIDPERFVSFYAARGWKSGQTAITDWRAAVDSWHRDDVSRSNSTISMPTYGGEENWSL